jgi:hypothetical protein
MEVSELVDFWFLEVFRAVILVFGVLAGLWFINNAVGSGD